ncbi:MAG TPA: MmcQ/YjbR family DNA-binding protein [Dongiaceae bacterium]|nr:MmcQ/YjbR family DNA-binding protein [Dongiaceae bacterium]
MNVEAVKKFCRSLPGATERESGEPANVLAYYVGAKLFAYFKTSDPEKWRFSFRVTPERFIELTDQPGIKPARYMHRFHWVTVVSVSSLEADRLKELIRWSYQDAFSRLTKKSQKEISGL